jgi:hypothetical protein
MLFSVDNPRMAAYVPPNFYRPKTMYDKFELAMLGYKPSGERNAFGRIASWVPVFQTTSGAAKRKFMQQGATQSLENLSESVKRDMQKLGTTLNLAGSVASAVTGNIPGALTLGGSFLSGVTGVASSKPSYNKWGSYVMNDYTSYKKGGIVSRAKAREILHDGTVHGKPLTDKQRKLFGAIASGKSLRKYGNGGNVKPTKQPKGVEPWEKVALAHPSAMKRDIMSYLGAGKLYLGDEDMMVADAESYDDQSRLVREQMPNHRTHRYAAGGMVGGDDGYIPTVYPAVIRAMDKGGNVEEDMVMIDKKTGIPQGEISYGENVFDKVATKNILSLASKKDYAGLGRFVANEIKTQPKNAYEMSAGGSAGGHDIKEEYVSLVKKYFPDDWQFALDILKAESGGDPNAYNDKNSNKTVDYGLFQINSSHEDSLKKAGIINSLKDLYDPETNIKAAAYVKNNDPNKNHETGWQQWSTYSKVAPKAAAYVKNNDPNKNHDTGLQKLSTYSKDTPKSQLSLENSLLTMDKRPQYDDVLRRIKNPLDLKDTPKSQLSLENSLLTMDKRPQYDDVLRRIKNPLDLKDTKKEFLGLWGGGEMGGGGAGGSWVDNKLQSSREYNPSAFMIDQQLRLPVPRITPFEPDMQHIPDTKITKGISYDAPMRTTNTVGVDPHPEPKERWYFDPVQFFNLAKAVTGMAGAGKNLPEWNIPLQWRDYMGRLRDASYIGLYPQERALYENDLDRAYAYDTSNIRDVSGGQSSFALGNQGAAINRFRRGAGEMEALDAGMRRRNMGMYGSMLPQDVEYGRMKFGDRYSEAMRDKIAASELSRSGLQGLFDQYYFDKIYGRGSTYDDWMRSQIEKNKEDTKYLSQPIDFGVESVMPPEKVYPPKSGKDVTFGFEPANIKTTLDLGNSDDWFRNWWVGGKTAGTGYSSR